MEERLDEVTDLLKAISSRLSIVENKVNADDKRTEQEKSVVNNTNENQNRSTQLPN